MKRIYVKGAVIRENATARAADPNAWIRPPIVVVDDQEVTEAYAVDVEGPSRLAYRPGNPIEGTTTEVWVETSAPLRIWTEHT